MRRTVAKRLRKTVKNMPEYEPSMNDRYYRKGNTKTLRVFISSFKGLIKLAKKVYQTERSLP